MELKTVKQLARVANIRPAAPAKPMTQVEKLERWAQLLEQNPGKRLDTFFETEYQRPVARDAMRAVESPISVAFADPILQQQGLAGDTYGEAQRFFELGDRHLHHVLCFCHYGSTVSAGTAARAIRGIIWANSRSTFWGRVRQIFW